MGVVVTGIGLVSCLGSLQTTWSDILHGRSGIKHRKIFLDLPVYPLGLIAAKPIQLSSLTQQILLHTLKDSGLALPLPECGVVIGSSRGCQANWEDLVSQRYNSQDSELNWLETLPHQSAIATARYIKTMGPVLSPMAACSTGIWALFKAYELIKTGQCERVIVGAVEAPITPLTLAAFERMGALAKTGCYPFDKSREGLVLGEGGAMFVLEKAQSAIDRQAKIYGEVLGFGLTCDAHHISSPLTKNGSAVRAIKQSLQNSNLEPEDIDYVHAHGTSTVLNDLHEAQLIKHIFPQNTAVSSTKGATGHTLGASGAINVALTLMSFKENYLLPCIGLSNSEFDLNLVSQARKKLIQNAMCFNFGFGGQNTVITLGSY